MTASPEPVSCPQVTAAELRVTLSGHGQPAFVLVHIPVCANGQVSLSVQAIQARPGVPGYTAAP
jgi:hypothetical protein